MNDANKTPVTPATLAAFVALAQELINEEYRTRFPNLTPSVLTTMAGRRYVRIVATTDGGNGQRSAHCFVDMTNGDILKTDGWKGPAKHARGTVHDLASARKAMSAYGAVYLG